MASKDSFICYETDASGLVGTVNKVVLPESVDDVKNVVKSASSEMDIVPRGGGSNIVGGCVPRKSGSIIVDMKKMNKVLDFDPKSKIVYAEAGVTIKELNEKLKAVNFEFPILCNEISTLGGMIARGEISELGKYGDIKNWVEEIEFVNGRGEFIKIGKSDLSDVCGMEGINGIILKAKLKIIPLSYRSASIFQSDNLHETLLIARRLRLEEEIIMLKLFDPYISKILGLPEKYNLIVFFDSDKGKINGDEFYEFFKKINKRDYFVYSKGFYGAVDAKFFIDKIDQFILFLEEIGVYYSVDLLNGIVISFFNEKSDEEKVLNIINKMNGKFVKYGFGLKRKGLIDNLQKKILHRVKLRHDPFRRFNNGKVFDFGDKIESFDEEIIRERFDDKKIDIKEEIKQFPIKKVLSGEGEEKSALRLVEDLEKKDFKKESEFLFDTPEEKMNKFIEEAQGDEEKEEVMEVKDKLLDYKQIFQSELSDKKVRSVESFAKDVSSNFIESEKNNLNVVHDLDTFDSEVGKVSVNDSLDRKSISESELRGKVSDNERSLIDDIMTNKFGMGGERKKDDKIDESNKKENFEGWE
jgi:hypothetical protein